MKIFTFLLVTICSCLLSVAQTTIKGTVLNKETNKPVPSASVYISNTTMGSVSNEQGVFTIGNIPEGKYELIVSCVGYETDSVLVGTNAVAKELVIYLKRSADQLKAFSVTSPVNNTQPPQAHEIGQREQDLFKYQGEYENKFLPFFFEREAPVGTVYFTEYWMRGAAVFANHKTIPTLQKPYFFNFDKMKNVLIVADNSTNVSYYKGDSVIQFILLDSLNKTYKFEIIPGISRSFYLQPVLTTDSGYSLYKRLITKLASADFQTYGYGHTGVRHDTYNDFYEYYFVYADKTTYKKFYLDGPAVKKVFKSWPAQLERTMNKFKNLLTEEAIVDLVESINKKGG